MDLRSTRVPVMTIRAWKHFLSLTIWSAILQKEAKKHPVISSASRVQGHLPFHLQCQLSKKQQLPSRLPPNKTLIWVKIRLFDRLTQLEMLEELFSVTQISRASTHSSRTCCRSSLKQIFRITVTAGALASNLSKIRHRIVPTGDLRCTAKQSSNSSLQLPKRL